MNRWVNKILLCSIAVILLLTGGSPAWAKDKGGKPPHHPPGLQIAPGLNMQGKGKVQVKLDFADMSGADVAWALQHIAGLASKRVFEGYEDGTFQPRKPVTRVEALTAMVRLMGLRDEAESETSMKAELPFKDSGKIYKQYPWAVGYVAVALENSLFFETDDAVQPEKPADRLWVTMMLIKALGLEAEARSQMTAKLPFKDAKSIPAGSNGYVALAVELGLVNGYEDGNFRPNQPVTRAELAALLDRLDAHLPDHEDNMIKGRVLAVSSDTLVLEHNGQSQVLNVDDETIVFKNGIRVERSVITSGDTILVRTYGELVLFIEITAGGTGSELPAITVSGLLHAVTLNQQGRMDTITITQAVYGGTQTVQFSVSAEVAIEGQVSELVLNKPVDLKLRGNEVILIKIKD